MNGQTKEGYKTVQRAHKKESKANNLEAHRKASKSHAATTKKHHPLKKHPSKIHPDENEPGADSETGADPGSIAFTGSGTEPSDGETSFVGSGKEKEAPDKKPPHPPNHPAHHKKRKSTHHTLHKEPKAKKEKKSVQPDLFSLSLSNPRHSPPVIIIPPPFSPTALLSEILGPLDQITLVAAFVQDLGKRGNGIEIQDVSGHSLFKILPVPSEKTVFIANSFGGQKGHVYSVFHQGLVDAEGRVLVIGAEVPGQKALSLSNNEGFIGVITFSHSDFSCSFNFKASLDPAAKIETDTETTNISTSGTEMQVRGVGRICICCSPRKVEIISSVNSNQTIVGEMKVEDGGKTQVRFPPEMELNQKIWILYIGWFLYSENFFKTGACKIGSRGNVQLLLLIIPVILFVVFIITIILIVIHVSTDTPSAGTVS